MTFQFPPAGELSFLAFATLGLAFLFGYLCGSIPFGLIFARAAGVGDLRAIGSGNIGATNVLRTGRKGVAAATLLADALKGAIAVLVAAQFGSGAALMAGVGAFVGHIFPVWLHFRGGKGIATLLGVTLGLDWRAGLIFIATWLLVAFATRFSSLAALIASAAMPLVFMAFGEKAQALVLAGMAMIAFWTHRENIARLKNGTESRIGRKA